MFETLLVTGSGTHTETVCCWNCTWELTPQTLSFGMPLRRIPATGAYEIQGYFCSLACVKRFMIDHQYHETLLTLFSRMVFEVYRCTTPIPTLTSPFLLKRFSGNKGLLWEAYQQHRVHVSTTLIQTHLLTRTPVYVHETISS